MILYILFKCLKHLETLGDDPSCLGFGLRACSRLLSCT